MNIRVRISAQHLAAAAFVIATLVVFVTFAAMSSITTSLVTQGQDHSGPIAAPAQTDAVFTTAT